MPLTFVKSAVFWPLAVALAGFIWGEGVPFILGAVLISGGCVLFVAWSALASRADADERTFTRYAAPLIAVFALLRLGHVVPGAARVQFLAHERALDRVVMLADDQISKLPRGHCVSGRQLPAVPELGGLSEVCYAGGNTYLWARGGGVGKGYGYIYAPSARSAEQAAWDSCVEHLDGPWWESGRGGGGKPCLAGFSPTGGG